jgi:hypothetical protein
MRSLTARKSPLAVSAAYGGYGVKIHQNQAFAASDKVVALHRPTSVWASGRLDLNNPLDQLAVERGLRGEWTVMLSDREMRLFLFITRMTTGFSRLSYRFTYREFIGGNPFCAGIPKDERHIRAALKGLEASGHISIAPDRRSGLDITVNLKGLYAVLAKRKRLKERHNPAQFDTDEMVGTPPTFSSATPLRNGGDIIEPDLEPISQNQPLVDADAPTLGSGLGEIGDDGKEEPARQIEPIRLQPAKPRLVIPAPSDNPLRLAAEPTRGPVKALGMTAGAVEAAWRRGFATGFEGQRGAVLKPWTMVEKAKVNKALVKCWTDSPARLHEFVEWSAENWTRITTTIFAWMTRSPPPGQPELGFFLHQRERFLDAFSRNTIAADREKLTPGEQRDMHDLLAKGFTRDEAFKSVTRSQAIGTIRKEIDERERNIAHQSQVLELTRKNLVKQFGNRPAPHRHGLTGASPFLADALPPPAEPYDGPPLFDMPDWDENKVMPLNLNPVAK